MFAVFVLRFFTYFCGVNRYLILTMSLKTLYRRFRAWQLEPYQFEYESDKSHKCFNCGEEFTGNYCPVCGQYYNEGPVNWSPDDKVHEPLWGLLGPGTLLSFIIQLIGRPGYMISDYLKGRKQVTCSPLEVLCYFGAAAFFVFSFTGKDGSAWVQYVEGRYNVIGKGLEWMLNHLDWAILIVTTFHILPVWLLFRFSRKHSHHNLKEGFFIQAFMASLVLICLMLRALISDWLILLIPLCAFVVYRQLFGYGVWGTLWRTLLGLGVVFYIFVVILVLWIWLSGRYTTIYSKEIHIVIAVALIAVGLGAVWLGYWISKKTEKKG